MLEPLIVVLLNLASSSNQVPDFAEPFAREHVEAAVAASHETGYPPELLLAMAYVESRYSPYALSRLQCKDGECVRRIGKWRSETKPRGAKSPWYCGVLQVGGYVSWERCLELRDITLAYAEGARHLAKWERMAARKYKSCRAKRDRLQCAIRGYNGGWKPVPFKCERRKTDNEPRSCRYQRAVFAMQARIRRDLAKLNRQNQS